MKVLSICTIVIMALAFVPAGSVLAAPNPLGPITSAVLVTPNPVAFNNSVVVTANIDNSALTFIIKSAEYSVNSGPWVAMSAVDGTFDSMTEAVTASFTAVKYGANQVCVHGDDVNGNTGPDVCAGFTVSDTTPPVVSNVKAIAVLTGSTGSATVTATIDDTNTGGSNIASAAYTLGGGIPTTMTALDGAFNSVKENVTATIPTITAGENKVCVTGTDLPGNTSAPTCITFTLFAFKGFQAPIKMGVTNKANAPQTIPIKWWLTDANGKPVSKATLFKTIAIMSYKVDCTSLVGDPTSAVVGNSPGKSGLKYQGNGRWMVNWKTEKSFRGTCRKMFVQFNGVQNSPEVVFAFK
jgi:hypothetical protein